MVPPDCEKGIRMVPPDCERGMSRDEDGSSSL